MKLRKFTSIGLFFSTIVISITGVALFFVHSSGKTYLKEGHECFGIAFLVFASIHTALNFKPLKNYFKKVKGMLPVSREFAVNSVIAIAMIAFTVAGASSMNAKMAASPYPAIESMPLSVVLAQAEVDSEAALTLLKAQGYVLPQGEITLGTLASANKQSPRLIYSSIISGMNSNTQELVFLE